MAPVTTQLSLPYNNTNFMTDLYTTPRNCIIAPVFYTTLPTLAHHRSGVPRFFYRVAQSLLLYTTVQPRYGKAMTKSRGSELTPIKNHVTLVVVVVVVVVVLLLLFNSPPTHCRLGYHMV